MEIPEPSKCCTGCRETLPLSSFFKHPRGYLGRAAKCKTCVTPALHASNKRWRERNAEEIKSKRKKYQEKNRERINAYYKKWVTKNTHRLRRYAKERVELIKQRTPEWADLDKIAQIYADCPPGYQVDHEIPLKGDCVCGLHVHENLQYLLAAENRAKGNKVPEMLNEPYEFNSITWWEVNHPSDVPTIYEDDDGTLWFEDDFE